MFTKYELDWKKYIVVSALVSSVTSSNPDPIQFQNLHDWIWLDWILMQFNYTEILHSDW